MWDIELNIAGYRFTHQVPDRRRRILAPVMQRIGLRPAQVRAHVRNLLAA